MKILIMGLPGSGKTWLAERLQKHLNCAWYNADSVRTSANDWDFTPTGRERQANRMKHLADFESQSGRDVICDFVAPTKSTREAFGADTVIWMNTIEKGRFEDTNKMFEVPEDVDHEVTVLLTDEAIKEFASWLL